jgi:paraquat-inducible protein B
MSVKPSSTVIGAFTLGAVALAVGALVVLGSGKLFTRQTRAVAFFDGDIQGLTIGAPVDLRGVQIGRVTDIKIRLDLRTMTPAIPVYIEFDPSRFDVQNASGAKGSSTFTDLHQQRLKTAIANGLHARLALQSLVTGQLLVELDLEPNAPRTLVGADPNTIEIPTSRSDIEKVKDAIARLPLDKLATAALQLLDDGDRLIRSTEIPILLTSLAASSRSLEGLLTSAQRDLDPTIANLNRTLDTARATLEDGQKTLRDARGTLTNADRLMSADLHRTLEAGTRALDQAERALSDADGLVKAGSAQRYDLDQILRNLSASTHALRFFSEDLERRPNALIMGK